jgi:crotonobetainyl-CoA:carnitine CoA-transferase CaiB-like acyl-CoA transferase
VADLWARAGLDAAALNALRLTGRESVLPSSFRVIAAAQASIGLTGLAAAEIFRARAGRSQTVSVDARHAGAEFRSEHYILDAASPPGDMWDPIAGVYPCADGWVRLHTNFPHHRDGILGLLGCAGTRAAVAASLATRSAATFESEATESGMCVAAMRSFAQWDAHPHAAEVAEVPLLIERIGEAPPEPFHPGPVRPLSAVRVLDLTRVIAGPVAGRTLAAHGADVLHVTGPEVPNIPRLILDTGRGKRATEIDLRTEVGCARLAALVRGADVFVQSYRPGSLARRGFGTEALARLRPGIVVATLSAYGDRGAWRGKRGFDSLVQTATGFNHAEAEAAGIGRPKPLPCQALDHASGYLLAFGTMAALLRRVAEGGSWRVTVSLSATGRWLRSLGRLPDGLTAPDLAREDIADLLETSGSITAIRHAAQLSASPAFWVHPALPLGSSPPVWQPREIMMF